MNRSRETMQFIQALSAPTRASFSLYLEYKELLAFIPVIPTASVHRLPTGLLPSILSFQSSRVRISTRHNNRNSKRIDLLPPFPLNIVPLFFRTRREDRFRRRPTTLCGSRLIANVRRKAGQSRDFSKVEARGVTYCMKYLWTTDKKRRAWRITIRISS